VRIAGYAALFGVADGGGDTIRPGAFARTLAEGAELPLLWQHDPRQRIGTVERIAEDGRGLRVTARVDRLASRAARLLRTRAVSGLSFGYRARGYRRMPGGRVLEDIDLFEVSLVARPLQHGARVHLVARFSPASTTPNPLL
jgi:HK97 family phage prohead protease